MSELRRERKQERAEAEAPKERNWGMIAVYAVLIAAAVGLAFYLGRRSQHKYDAFAHCLTDRGVKMYGAWWCPHCTEQKEKFSASFEYVPYVECGVKGDLKGKNPVCGDAGIQHFPTWQFPPTGERVEQVLSLEALSERTGCALP
jgi:hypothetical protein